jgi:hypothetical protein
MGSIRHRRHESQRLVADCRHAKVTIDEAESGRWVKAQAGYSQNAAGSNRSSRGVLRASSHISLRSETCKLGCCTPKTVKALSTALRKCHFSPECTALSPCSVLTLNKPEHGHLSRPSVKHSSCEASPLSTVGQCNCTELRLHGRKRLCCAGMVVHMSLPSMELVISRYWPTLRQKSRTGEHHSCKPARSLGPDF